MKRMNKFATMALIAGGLAAGATAARAATIASSSPDLILSFEVLDQNATSTGGQEDLEIDLGTLAHLDALAGGSPGDTVQLTNYLSNTDLNNIYGTNWATRTTPGSDPVYWTVFGTNTGGSAISSSSPYAFENFYTDSVAPNNDSSGNQQTLSSEMSSIYTDLNGKTSTANSNFAFEANSSSDSESFTQDSSDGTNWGDPGGDVPGNVLQKVGNTNNFILYDEIPNASGKGVDVGMFSLSDSGVMTFTEEAVPEPCTWWAMLAAGASVLILFRRRGVSMPA